MRLFPQDQRINKVHYDIDYFEQARHNEVVQYWRYYEGHQWAYHREAGEPTITINYAKAVVDVGVDFLMGNSFTITAEDEEVKNAVVPILEEVWEDNDRDMLAQELALSGGVTGDAWLEVTFDEKLQRVVLNVIDSTWVYADWDPHDKDEMLQCTIMYPAWKKLVLNESAPDMFRDPTRGGTSDIQMYTYKKVYTKEMVREYHDDVLVNELANPIGLIPVAHIKNMPGVGNYGVSDLKDVVNLNREYNEKITDTSDIINYHAAPTTVIFGARAASLEKGAKKIWSGLPKDARVENVQLQSELAATQLFLEHMEKSIQKMSGIPAHAMGDIQPVSNTSGVALQMMYHPIVRKTKKKRVSYSKGIKEANVLILKFLEAYGVLEESGVNLAEMPEAFDTKIEFPEMLPKDELLERQMDMMDLQMGVASKADVLRRRGVKEEQIQKILGEAMAEQEQQMMSQMQAQYDMMGMPLDNTEGSTPQGAAQAETRRATKGNDANGRPRKA